MLSNERQRRSRIDWAEYLPSHLVPQQVGFERNMTALAMRKAGKKYGEIGSEFGVCRGRARQMVKKGERQSRRSQFPMPAEMLYAGRLSDPMTPTDKKKLAAFFAALDNEGK